MGTLLCLYESSIQERCRSLTFQSVDPDGFYLIESFCKEAEESWDLVTSS